MSKKSTATAKAPQEIEAEYTVEEFSASGVFGDIAPDIVTAALHEAGVVKTTKSAAESIIKKFMQKEVK